MIIDKRVSNIIPYLVFSAEVRFGRGGVLALTLKPLYIEASHILIMTVCFWGSSLAELGWFRVTGVLIR